MSDGPDANPGNATGNATEPAYDRLANPQSADDVRITSWWWWIGRNILSVYFRTRYRAKKVRGKDNIPRRGGVLIVANHMTNNDPFLVGWSAIPRRAFYMGKAELFENRIQRTLIGTLGAFPIRRGEADRTAMRIAKGLLARGELVIIFPEGTRSRDQRLRNPYPGAASLGLPDDAPLLPVLAVDPTAPAPVPAAGAGSCAAAGADPAVGEVDGVGAASLKVTMGRGSSTAPSRRARR